MNRVKRTEKGFTLVELMITLAVISLAVIGAIGTNIMIQQSVNSNHDRAIAAQDAHEVLEAMRDATNDQPTLTFHAAAKAAGEAAAADAVNVLSLPAAYGQTIVVSCVNSGGNTVDCAAAGNPMDVTVTVTWQDRGLAGAGAARTLALRTLLTKRNT